MENNHQAKVFWCKILLPCFYLLVVLGCIKLLLLSQNSQNPDVGFIALIGLLIILMPWIFLTGILLLGIVFQVGDEYLFYSIVVLTALFNILTFFAIYSLTKSSDT
jgi:hypothetical protein